MPPPVSFFDVGDGERLATWIFEPPAGVTPRPQLLFCLPGGSYSKAYWHLEVPGHPGYSCAEHLARHGYTVIAVDHLGVGESTRPPGRTLTLERLAGANARLVERVVEHMALEAPVPVAIGHSMGGLLAVYQQSLHRSFAALAVLGFPHGVMDLRGGRASLPTREQVEAAAAAGKLDAPALLDRRPLHPLFHWDDVPAAVIEADDAAATPTPGIAGAIGIVPYIGADHAARIDVPVLVGFGERDNARDAWAEVAPYRSAPDVTLVVLPRSGHCHNLASTRTVLWDRLARWIASVTDRG